ncbi:MULTISPECIES: DUF3466 family protein [unclassified Duganella]|uniref:DUF3466 family protein n=1 Tax=unclassified Duganella TaxID=2636909 RepID=UPI0013149D86|nr:MULTISPECIES: DUF3466 family protein [unclassified Duganella]
MGWQSINNFGDLAGGYSAYIGGQFSAPPATDWGATYYQSNVINDKGVVGGTIGDHNSGYAILSSKGSSVLLPSFNQSYNSFASVTALNNVGQGAGVASTTHRISSHDGESIWSMHAFRTDGSTITDLGTLGGFESEANGINNKGEVVGWASLSDRTQHGFVTSGGKMVDLGGIAGANSDQAIDINDAGLIIGNADFGWSHNSYAYVHANGTSTLIETPNGFQSKSSALNNYGQIVGRMWDRSRSYGFMYVNGQVIDLNTFIDPAQGWSVEAALDINDRGQILTRACKNQGRSCTEMILSPDILQSIPTPQVPEPATYAMMLTGLGMLAWSRRSKRQAK